MKKIVAILLSLSLLVVFAPTTYAASNLFQLDVDQLNVQIESAYVNLIWEDGTELLAPLSKNGQSGLYSIKPKVLAGNPVIDYFLVNDVECYIGRQVLLTREKGTKLYTLDTLETVYLITINDKDRCIVTGELRYIAGDDVRITGSFTDEDERIRQVGVSMSWYGAYVYPHLPVNDFMDLHLELSNSGDTWNWIVEVDGLDSDGRIFVFYEPIL